ARPVPPVTRGRRGRRARAAARRSGRPRPAARRRLHGRPADPVGEQLHLRRRAGERRRPRPAGDLQAPRRRGPALRLPRRHPLQAGARVLPPQPPSGLGDCPADGGPGRAERRRLGSALRRAGRGRGRPAAILGPLRARDREDGAVRPRRQQRRSQDRPLPARRPGQGLGHRPRPDLPPPAEAADGALAVRRPARVPRAARRPAAAPGHAPCRRRRTRAAAGTGRDRRAVRPRRQPGPQRHLPGPQRAPQCPVRLVV
ncbi:MAG: hypothetical protein AVDCRST_MAG49-2958, partial [uncultured Thermomicrobiales bacterium]